MTGNPVPPAEVARMFDRIAPVYDAMNALMTGGLDARWRRAALAAMRLRPGDAGLDVACGTGPLTRAVAAAVGPAGRAVGVDLAPRMLDRARRRRAPRGAAAPSYVRGDALALPFADATFDAAVIAFGLRNVADYAACLREMRRVVRDGGRVVVLEIGAPSTGVAGLLHRTWFRRGVPLLGRLAGSPAAYRYLPDSVRRYPDPPGVARLLADVGLEGVTWRGLSGGLVTLHVGRRGAAG